MSQDVLVLGLPLAVLMICLSVSDLVQPLAFWGFVSSKKIYFTFP
jgi:hypothetical protein